MSKIFIDAGHNNNGWNTGASGNGLREQDINYAVAKKLGELLTAQGLEIKLSRPTKETNLGINNSSSITTRYTTANNWGADYFISIHCNAGGGTGSETLYYKDNSKAYAQTIQDVFIQEMGLRNRGIKYRDNIGVIMYAKMPSVLIELAFIDTAADAAILANKQDELATAIAKGFYKMLGITEKTTEQYPISQENLTVMVDAGVMNTSNYWRRQNVKYLNELLSKAAGVVCRDIDNGITDINMAFEALIQTGVINTSVYWKNLIAAGTVEYLDVLIIGIANKIKV